MTGLHGCLQSHGASAGDNPGVIPIPYAAAAAAVAQIGGSLLSSSQGAGAAKSAADTQAAAADRATALQQQIYQDTVSREQPFYQAGTNALTQLQNMLGLGPGGAGPSSPILAMLGIGPQGATGGGINPATFQGNPGFQYQYQQGLNAVTNSNARSGLGGNALRSLQATGQGLANQNWQQYLGNASSAWNQLLGGVGGLAAGGQQAAVNQGNAGTAFGQQAGSNIIGAGNALAAGTVGAANNWGQGIGGAVGGLSQLFSNPQFMALLQGSGGGTQVPAGTDPNALAMNTPFTIPSGVDTGTWG